MYQHWIDREISTGFQKLILLSLERTPAQEVIDGTVDAWIEAITKGRNFIEERDAPRFREAFLGLMQTCTQWPQPYDFLINLPPLPDNPAVARLIHDQGRENGMRAIDDIYRKMGWTKRGEDESEQEVDHDPSA